MIEEITRLASQLNDYINAGDASPVVDYKSPQELAAILKLDVPEEGLGLDRLSEFIQTYLNYSVRTAHPLYFNQLWAGFSLPSLQAEMVGAATNTSMYTYEVAPVATLLEHFVVKKLGELMGLKDSEGLLVTGGSNGNLVALLMARNMLLRDAKFSGLFSSKPLVMFVSDQAHYSYKKAANTIGIGMANVVSVASDRNGAMRTDALENAIDESFRQGKHPFFIGATAGTTVLGAFDPLKDLAAVAKKHSLWFHVDAAFGGSAILSSKHKHLLAGSELADSIVWDWHKMLGLPLMCSALLVAGKGTLLETVSTGHQADEEYIFHEKEGAHLDLGPLSLQCGRRVDVLKLWLTWQSEGSLGLGRRVDSYFSLAEQCEARVKREAKLELVRQRQSVAVCFRYVPSVEVDLDNFNRELRERLLRSGETAVNYATVDGKVVIRLITVNPRTTSGHVEMFFDAILKEGGRLEMELKSK